MNYKFLLILSFITLSFTFSQDSKSKEKKEIKILNTEVDISYNFAFKSMGIYGEHTPRTVTGKSYSGSHIFTSVNTAVFNYKNYNFFDLKLTVDTNLSLDSTDSDVARFKASLANLVLEKFGLSLKASLGNYDHIRSGLGPDSFKFAAITPLEVTISKQVGKTFYVDAKIAAGVTSGLSKNIKNPYLPEFWDFRLLGLKSPTMKTGLYLKTGTEAKLNIGSKASLELSFDYSSAQGRNVKKINSKRRYSTLVYNSKLSMFDYSAELNLDLEKLFKEKIKNSSLIIGYNSTASQATTKWHYSERGEWARPQLMEELSNSTPQSIVKNHFHFFSIGLKVGL